MAAYLDGDGVKAIKSLADATYARLDTVSTITNTLETLQTQVSELVDALTTEEIDTAFAGDSTDDSTDDE